MKHKHYDMIVEWAKDPSRKVESRRPGFAWRTLTVTPVWDESVEYRFADSVLKYRVALFGDGEANWVDAVRTEAAERSCEAAGNFIRWLTDWTEVIDAPKPKMNKYERWLNLYPDGGISIHTSDIEADEYARSSRVECRHIEWEVPA